MRTEVDLDAAAKAGIIGEDQAIALRNFQAESDGFTASTSEKFQLFGGYADLVIGIGAAMVFGALAIAFAEIGRLNDNAAPHLFAAAFIAFGAFKVATKINMRASPALGMVLTLAYGGFALAALVFALMAGLQAIDTKPNGPGILWLLVPIHAGLMRVHWKRFRFPPTIALVIAAYSLFGLAWLAEEFRSDQWLVAGTALMIATGTMISAIWWDLTDIRRETERSQVAFWLHCCAGVLMSRALFSLLTGSEVIDGNVFYTGLALRDAPFVILLIGAAAVISLLLDRRSLLVGCLVPIVTIFDGVASGPAAAALGLALAGTALIVFSTTWITLRTHLLNAIPQGLAAQLPRTNLRAEGQRPTRQHKDLWHLR